ncbi:haloacid dehalogenase [Rhizocola hellebori]|uniref:Haloacid dehalogenase n=1 Tax=Rhizocola hellebori TaxID=1392758 RepID=A0A8J3VMG4_9ACTN|nr:HAD family hydrolase [Rhizocola hellebori]GIH11652.1 haloacid dehalogenase [Rhizocola hellebori]
MIATVAFDADETLVDTPAAVTAGLTALVGELAVPDLTVEAFRTDANDCWAEIPEKSAREIRTVATLRTLKRFGLGHELERMIEIFFEVRFANSRPYAGVVETLEKLRPEYQLGYATNANSEAHRCGLKDQFAFEIYALRTGIPKKPAVAFYAAVAEAAGDRPEEIVYVGDSYEHDIVGPAAYGMRTVWLNKKGLPVPGETQPDAVIDNLMELPRILAGWR